MAPRTKIRLLLIGVVSSIFGDASSVLGFFAAASLKGTAALSEDSALFIIKICIGGMVTSFILIFIFAYFLFQTYERQRLERSGTDGRR